MEDVATGSGATDEEAQERIESLLSAEDGEEPDPRKKNPEGEEPKGEEPEDEGEAEEESPEKSEDEGSDEEESDDTEEEDDDEESEADEEEETLGVEELAQYLGVDENLLEVNEDGELFIRTKVDGEDGRAKLNDLVKSYQLEGHLNKRNMEVADLQKQLEEQRTQEEQKVNEKVQQLDDTLQIAWRELGREFESVDWERLKEEDRGEYAALKQDFEERKRAIQGAYQRVHQYRQEQHQKQIEEFKKTVKEQAERLPELIPEWKDEKVAAAEKKQVVEYAKSIGFSDEEVNGIADARAVAALRKAMKYDKLQSTKPTVTKKVRKAPRVTKPGTSKSPGDRKSANLKRLRSNVKKSGGSDDAVAGYLLESGNV